MRLSELHAQVNALLAEEKQLQRLRDDSRQILDKGAFFQLLTLKQKVDRLYGKKATREEMSPEDQEVSLSRQTVL